MCFLLLVLNLRNLIVFKILQTPGPGTYKPIDGISNDGTYAQSGHMRTRTPSMQRKTTDRSTKYDRIPAPDKHQPGPGWYDLSPQSLSTAILSKALPMTHQRSHAGFGTVTRKVFVSDSFTPGPGSYLAPSAFGQYIGERALLAN